MYPQVSRGETVSNNNTVICEQDFYDICVTEPTTEECYTRSLLHHLGGLNNLFVNPQFLSVRRLNIFETAVFGFFIKNFIFSTALVFLPYSLYLMHAIEVDLFIHYPYSSLLTVP